MEYPIAQNRRPAIDNDTEGTRHRAATQREMILRLAFRNGDEGITSQEVADMLGTNTQLAGARMQELRSESKAAREANEPPYLRRTERFRTTHAGRKAIVHVLTNMGYMEARKLDTDPAASPLPRWND